MTSLPEIFLTDDGSYSLLDTALNVSFHSTHGAITESRHVFLDAGFDHVASTRSHIRLLEIGYGSGLNALLTLVRATELNNPVIYVAIEPNPLEYPLIRKLNYPQQLGKPGLESIFRHMHGDREGTPPSQEFELHLVQQRVQDFKPTTRFDLVYYDAFAPGAQPELWGKSTLGHVRDMLDIGAVLVTYCAKGQFKRDLKSLGFVVESLPGPPGKREMVRATLQSQ